MKRSLKKLTKEDWNTLFPIELVNHNPNWKNIYEEEKHQIISKVGKEIILRIEHFGSSSIPKIKSKPYIDMMIEVPKKSLFKKMSLKLLKYWGIPILKSLKGKI